MMQNNLKPPSNTAFKQQRLKACQPIFTPQPVIIVLAVIFVAFLIIGIVLVTASNDLVEGSIEYTNLCSINTTCTIQFTIKEKMLKPVYFYYELQNYYQNHRRYVSSRSDYQLQGHKITSYSDVSSCDPLVTTDDSHNIKKLIQPCGLIAGSQFNDTFVLRSPNGTEVQWTENGIAWQSDLDEKFKNPKEAQDGLVLNPPDLNYTDPAFVNWMRTAALPTFRKLYRIIQQDLPPGDYQIEIDNQYPVKSFNGKKKIVISEVSWIGGKNLFLGVTYLCISGLSIVFAIAFCIAVKVKPRSLGDISNVKRFEMH